MFKWWHNRKHKHNPECPCGWRMIKSTRKGFLRYWKCKWEQCTWEAFVNGTSSRVKFWHE